MEKERKRLFPEIASLDEALNKVALALPGTFEFKRKKLEEDVETGF